MKTPDVEVQCPYCCNLFTAAGFRAHVCIHGRISKQDWFVVVDKALAKAGKPAMIYGYDIEYLTHTGRTGSFHCAISSETAARRKAVYIAHFREVTNVTPLTYNRYCQAFGLPGSKM